MRAAFTAIFGGLALCACSSSAEDETGTTTSTVESLCDESDGVRVAATTGGGFVDPTYEFTNPYGFRFLFVDGGCRYFTSRSTLEGVRSGEVTESGALAPLALEGDLGWSELGMWGAHEDENCPDGGTTSITDGVSTAACSCGCDADAPAGMNEVFEGFSGLVDTLAEAATPLDGPMQFLLVEALVDGPPTVSFEWPLAWDPATVSRTFEEIIASVEGTPVTDAAELAALRGLREEARAAYEFDRPIRVTATSGAEYDLHLRDELPAEVASAVETMLAP